MILGNWEFFTRKISHFDAETFKDWVIWPKKTSANEKEIFSVIKNPFSFNSQRRSYRQG